MKLKVLPGGREERRRRGAFGRLQKLWRTVVVRPVLLALTGWVVHEGGRAEPQPRRAA